MAQALSQVSALPDGLQAIQADVQGARADIERTRIDLRAIVSSTDQRISAQIDKLASVSAKALEILERRGDRFIAINPPGGRSYELSLGGEGSDIYHDSVAGGWNRDIVWHFLNRWIKAGDVFFDLGANIGTLSINAAVRGASTHCFEMLAANVIHIAKSAARNDLNTIRIVQGAVGLSSEMVGIKGHSAWGQRSGSEALILIPGIVIDEYVAAQRIAHVSVMKIDVEGAERDALAGAQRLIERDSPDIVIEANAWTCGQNGYSYRDLLRTLQAAGYTIYRLQGDDIWIWDIEVIQEVLNTDYFATRRSLSEVRNRSGYTVRPMPTEVMVQSIIDFGRYGGHYKGYVLANRDRLLPAITSDHRVQAILSEWAVSDVPINPEVFRVGSA